jgi:hypothetical protein
MGWAGGNAIAPQLFIASWAPRYLNTLYIHLGLYAAFATVCITMRMLLVSRNKKKIAAQTQSDGTVVNNHEHAFEVSFISLPLGGSRLKVAGFDRP